MPVAPRIGVVTFGCKLNQCESESIAASFANHGFTVTDLKSDADLYLVNTCTVTSKGEQKARRIIRKLHTEHPGAVILVTGCYAQLNPGDLAGLGDRVVVVSLDDKALLLELPAGLAAAGRVTSAEVERFLARRMLRRYDPADRFRFYSSELSFHTRAFIKIQDGCDNRCAYCRVTIARGDSVSLDADEVVRRAVDLAATGHRELVITGVNISQYESGGVGLAELLRRLPGELPGIRIRLSSLEPDAVDANLADALSHPRICPHFHLPVQSGSDSVLNAMARRYDTDGVRTAVEVLRRIKDDPFIAADVIVGFPGESDHDFTDTYSLLESLDFAQMHVFPFSPRPDTAAAAMGSQVPSRTAKERAARLRALSEERHAAYFRRCVGRSEALLLEHCGSDGWHGSTGNYLKLRLDCAPPEAETGLVLPVRIVEQQKEMVAKYSKKPNLS